MFRFSLFFLVLVAAAHCQSNIGQDNQNEDAPHVLAKRQTSGSDGDAVTVEYGLGEPAACKFCIISYLIRNQLILLYISSISRHPYWNR